MTRKEVKNLAEFIADIIEDNKESTLNKELSIHIGGLSYDENKNQISIILSEKNKHYFDLTEKEIIYLIQDAIAFFEDDTGVEVPYTDIYVEEEGINLYEIIIYLED